MRKSSIIIPVYSANESLFDMTINCVDSIRKFDTSSEIIIVNNASKYFYSEPLRKYVDRIINLPSNLGYGHANNLGARISKYETLLFLNNDTIWHENIIEKLIVNKKEFISGAAGAKLKWENNLLTFSHCCNEDFDYIEGWCLLTTKFTFYRLGGFDVDTYGLVFSEDADLCFRAKFRFNIPLVVAPCKITHLRAQSVPYLPERDILYKRNAQLLTKRWGDYFKNEKR